ncbi:MAG: DUF1641 domain-containing protein [Dehalococcoidaceae bacterium]|nr:DUF1641 domain-containing protein [Dehalococcoidaceae bacterium]
MESQDVKILDEKSYEELEDLLSLVALLRGYLNDHVIKDLADTMASLSGLASAMAGTDLVNVLEKAMQDPELDRALLDPPRIGLAGMLKTMGDADVQKGMGILLTLLKAMGKAAGNT